MTDFEDISDYWYDSASHILNYIETPQEAQQYVNRILNASSEYYILEYANIYFGYAQPRTLSQTSSQLRSTGKRKQRGGTKFFTCEDPEDVQVYTFLSAFDTIHDVCSLTEDGEWKYGISIQDVLKTLECTLPEGVSDDMLLNEPKLIDYLANEQYLKFGEKQIDNPLYQNGIGHFDCTRYKQTNAYVNKLSKSCENCPDDARNNFFCIMSENEISDKVSAKQILQLLKYVRVWFGVHCHFQLDIDHKATKVFNALKVIDKAWFSQFTNGSITFPKFVELLKQVIPQESQWTSYITDAKMFDGMPHQIGIEYDTRPTGWIFRNDATKFNICLKGLDFKYRVCFNYTDGTDKCMKRNDAELHHTTNQLFLGTEDILKSMSIKRAGDWGQIEHCKRYDKVFVTFDRLAALYAYYRKIKFIHIRHVSKKNEPLKTKCWKQYTFLISRYA
jgi:hypothetical protein